MCVEVGLNFTILSKLRISFYNPNWQQRERISKVINQVVSMTGGGMIYMNMVAILLTSAICLI